MTTKSATQKLTKVVMDIEPKFFDNGRQEKNEGISNDYNFLKVI